MQGIQRLNNKVDFTMATTTGAFGIERAGQTLVVTVQTDLRELDFRGVEAGASEIFDQLARGAVKDVVLDFRNTDYYGSTALGFFVKLWKRLKERDGRMAFCGVSAHEREILKVTNLDGLWPVYATREEALRAMQARDDSRRLPRRDMDAQC